ncbi:MAG TPA: hypothetical protein PLO24_06615 [Bacteroidales bacterium]|nr:hypothetical protein [Bacteroidales bacterium]HOS71994.1 hypothetical protein [Bacteroidales bacterium]HQH23009.1 hypothetical protein [Bacteroidales bacterium]HQJ82172.1 hypothetical protein [Bacteroidales bacterium]
MKAVFFLHIAVIMLISASCSGYYGHDIDLSATYSGAVCSPNSSEIYFLCQTRASQKGKNLWFIMPIEGKTRFLHNNVSLYSFDTTGIRLTRLFDYGNLPNYLSSWKAEIIPLKDGVCFSISPKLGGWDEMVSKDSNMVSVRQQFEGIFFIDRDGEVKRLDSQPPADDVVKPEKGVRFYVGNLPYSEFGLILQEFDPGTEKYYLKTLEQLGNTSTYRRAVIEQVLAVKDKNTISKVYDNMLRNLNEMKEGSKKMMKEMDIKDNLEQIQALLQSK